MADPETADLHEVELVERARGGNVQAWARLYQERHDWLLREVTFLVGDLSLAEDLVQESFARALSGLPRDGPTCHTGCAESR